MPRATKQGGQKTRHYKVLIREVLLSSNTNFRQKSCWENHQKNFQESISKNIDIIPSKMTRKTTTSRNPRRQPRKPQWMCIVVKDQSMPKGPGNWQSLPLVCVQMLTQCRQSTDWSFLRRDSYNMRVLLYRAIPWRLVTPSPHAAQLNMLGFLVGAAPPNTAWLHPIPASQSVCLCLSCLQFPVSPVRFLEAGHTAVHPVLWRH